MIHDAEKLLGGYATGTLTEAERRELMAAALEHQALFDALADEEALRELLADPGARAELLAQLEGTPPSNVRPFWRRHPGILGLAASLLIAVTAGVAYLRTPSASELRKAPAPQVGPVEVQPPAQPAAKPISPAEPTPAKALRRREADKEAAPQADALGEPARSAPVILPEAVAPMPAAPPPPPSAPAPKAKAVEEVESARARGVAAHEATFAKKAERKATREPQAAAGAAGTTWSAPPAQAQDAAKSNLLAPGVSGLVASGGAEAPTWTFEGAAEGALQLRVQHVPGRQVYLIRRTPDGPVLVAPLPRSPQQPGITRFPLPPAPGPLDLYVLVAPPANPVKLPAEGPFPGFRVRVEAPKPK